MTRTPQEIDDAFKKIQISIFKNIDTWVEEMLQRIINNQPIQKRGLWNRFKGGLTNMVYGRQNPNNPYYNLNRFGDQLGSTQESYSLRMKLKNYLEFKECIESTELSLNEVLDPDIEKLSLVKTIRQEAEKLKQKLTRVFQGIARQEKKGLPPKNTSSSTSVPPSSSSTSVPPSSSSSSSVPPSSSSSSSSTSTPPPPPPPPPPPSSSSTSTPPPPPSSSSTSTPPPPSSSSTSTPPPPSSSSTSTPPPPSSSTSVPPKPKPKPKSKTKTRNITQGPTTTVSTGTVGLTVDDRLVLTKLFASQNDENVLKQAINDGNFPNEILFKLKDIKEKLFGPNENDDSLYDQIGLKIGENDKAFGALSEFEHRKTTTLDDLPEKEAVGSLVVSINNGSFLDELLDSLKKAGVRLDRHDLIQMIKNIK